jgi:hypothetical protein
MRNFLRDREHLVRMALLFLAGIAVFLGARALLVPASFNEYGHYRGAALAETASRAVAYAGREACEGCHADVVEARAGSRHAAIACEACHGALAKHAEDPAQLTPPRPDTRALCLRCHTRDGARPRAFPQVNPHTHMGSEACSGCHQPHRPAK